jgi:hypothetical protein
MSKRTCTHCGRTIAEVAFRANYQWGESGEQEECWECRRCNWVVHIHQRRAYKRRARAYRAVLLYDPCSYCGEPALTTDHIIPAVAAGSSEVGNLTAACDTCNVAKGSRFLLEHLLDEDLYVDARARSWLEEGCPRYAEESSLREHMPDLLFHRYPTENIDTELHSSIAP